MKKFIAIVMIVAAFGAGLWFGNGSSEVDTFKKIINRDWDYSRTLDRMEVRADYDDEKDVNGVPACYTEVLCWNEEFTTYRIVANGYYSKTDLADLNDKMFEMQEMYTAKVFF